MRRKKLRQYQERRYFRKNTECDKKNKMSTSNFIIGSERRIEPYDSGRFRHAFAGQSAGNEEVIEKIEAVTQKDLADVAELVFAKPQMSYSAVGNLKGVDFANTVEKLFS